MLNNSCSPINQLCLLVTYIAADQFSMAMCPILCRLFIISIKCWHNESVFDPSFMHVHISAHIHAVHYFCGFNGPFSNNYCHKIQQLVIGNLLTEHDGKQYGDSIFIKD